MFNFFSQLNFGYNYPIFSVIKELLFSTQTTNVQLNSFFFLFGKHFMCLEVLFFDLWKKLRFFVTFSHFSDLFARTFGNDHFLSQSTTLYNKYSLLEMGMKLKMRAHFLFDKLLSKKNKNKNHRTTNILLFHPESKIPRKLIMTSTFTKFSLLFIIRQTFDVLFTYVWSTTKSE